MRHAFERLEDLNKRAGGMLVYDHALQFSLKYISASV